MAKFNKLQEDFIDQIKEKVKETRGRIAYRFDPPRFDHHEVPDPSFFYRRPVLVNVPHLQWPDIELICDSNDCNGRLKPWVWNTNYRILQGLSEPIALLQYQHPALSTLLSTMCLCC
jgi:hypothetical protein